MVNISGKSVLVSSLELLKMNVGVSLNTYQPESVKPEVFRNVD